MRRGVKVRRCHSERREREGRVGDGSEGEEDKEGWRWKGRVEENVLMIGEGRAGVIKRGKDKKERGGDDLK